MTILEFLDYDTFLSVWYWALVVLAWSLACHYTMGVPFDVVVRAERQGGQHAEDCDQLALIHARRIATVLRRGGPFIAAFAGFLLVSLATLGFWFGQEIASAFFLLLAPVMLVTMLGARRSLQVLAQAQAGKALRRIIARRRFWDQVIGVAAIGVTALITGWHALNQDLQASGGIALREIVQSLLARWF